MGSVTFPLSSLSLAPIEGGPYPFDCVSGSEEEEAAAAAALAASGAAVTRRRSSGSKRALIPKKVR